MKRMILILLLLVQAICFAEPRKYVMKKFNVLFLESNKSLVFDGTRLTNQNLSQIYYNISYALESLRDDPDLRNYKTITYKSISNMYDFDIKWVNNYLTNYNIQYELLEKKIRKQINK